MVADPPLMKLHQKAKYTQSVEFITKNVISKYFMIYNVLILCYNIYFVLLCGAVNMYEEEADSVT